jgi:hypothetical protein
VTGETPIPEIAVGHLYELQSEPQPVAGFPKQLRNHVEKEQNSNTVTTNKLKLISINKVIE